MTPMPWRAALALALAAAVSLGLSRFSYALLLPPMRADLGWSYLLAGAMNTLNAVGYLAGALAMPMLLRRFDARAAMLAGGAGAALLLAAHGLVRSDAALAGLRMLTGAASAASFVGGGVLAARLAGQAGARAGLVLGLYYGGVGLGIVASALSLPPLAWPQGWWALGGLAALATALTAAGTRKLVAPPMPGAARAPVPLRAFAFGLAGYAMFGLGYIGYMTFVITLLSEQGWSTVALSGFYVLLGLGVMASPWLWAGLLQRHRGGVPLAVLNALLAVATAVPVLASHPLAVLGSGLLFGCVFLSLVASTTALVRHNLPADAWPAGIAAFTTVFAAGQIVGPSLVGHVADGAGGLARGFVLSAALLAAGALLALGQRPLR
ncbi:YbfB/YjiJ family MFS transporter [Rubrivivax albus]|nr:YbfB/YjiJ family MFS transporter [Rubrivivax albus]